MFEKLRESQCNGSGSRESVAQTGVRQWIDRSPKGDGKLLKGIKFKVWVGGSMGVT